MKVGYWLVGMVVLFAVGFLFAVSSEAKVVDPKNIAGMWLFDEDDKVAEDTSGNGNTGTFVNGPEWSPDGKFGGALEFNGTNHVNCGNGPSLDITDEITVVAWVRFDAVDYKGGAGGLFTVAAKGYPDALAPHAGWWFSHDNRNSGSGFSYTCFGNKNGGWGGGGNRLNVGNFQFTKGEWHHVAFTVGESIGKLYIDGIQLGSNAKFADLVLSDTTMDLTIGSAGSNWQFNGLIDEFAIFNVELSEGDIQTVMNEGLERSSGLTAVLPSGKLTTAWGSIKE
jgi:hypothetical protein